MRAHEFITEKWSAKYKRSINCNNPKGFSQKAHCAGRKKNEDVDLSIDVAKAIDMLPNSRLQDVIEMRFKYNMTFDEIGKELGVGKDRARQIVMKALRHLRHPKYGLTDSIDETALDEGVMDAITDFLKPYIEKAQGKLKKLQGAVKQEYMETDLMWEIMKKGNNARPFEIEFANKQFKDVLKGVGLGAWLALPIPGNTLWITLLEKLLNKFDVSIMPDEVKRQVFNGMYENLEEITRRNVLKGLGLAGVAAATGAKVDVAKAAQKAGGATAREKILAMKPGEQFWYVKVVDPIKPTDRQEYVFSLDTFKSIDDARKTVREVFRSYGYETDIRIEVTLARKKPVKENFADGKKKGKSRPGRVKRAGASCNGSVTDLRKRAKNSSGEKAKMYHWCANMKSGKKK